MNRYVETFFRYWRIALVPIVVLPLVVLAAMTRSSSPVTVSADIWISSSAHLGYADYNVTPSQNFANVAGQLLGSSSFVERVAQQSRLYQRQAALERSPKSWEETDLHDNVKFAPKGPNLVGITYTAKSASVGVQLLQGVIMVIPGELERLNRVGQGVFAVVDAPAAQPTSIGKKQLLLLLLVPLLVGVVLGGAFIVVRTALDRSIRRPGEVETLLGLPVLAVMPYGATANSTGSRRHMAIASNRTDAEMEPLS